METTTVLQMNIYCNYKAMIYLNFTNLDKETQQYLLDISKKEIEDKNGVSIKSYAEENHLNYETLLEQEAQRNLYTFDYVFNI